MIQQASLQTLLQQRQHQHQRHLPPCCHPVAPPQPRELQLRACRPHPLMRPGSSMHPLTLAAAATPRGRPPASSSRRWKGSLTGDATIEASCARGVRMRREHTLLRQCGGCCIRDRLCLHKLCCCYCCCRLFAGAGMYYDENSSSSGSEERGSSGSDNSFDSRHNRGDGGCSRSRKDTRSPAAGLVVGSVDVEDPGTEQGPQRGWKQRMCCGRGAGSPAGKTGKGDAAPSWFVLQRTKFRLQRVRFSACCSDCCAVLCLLPDCPFSPPTDIAPAVLCCHRHHHHSAGGDATVP